MTPEYTSPKKCHMDGMHIMTIGNCTIHGSSNRHLYDGYKLIINISNYSYSDRQIATCRRGANKLVSHFMAALPKKKDDDPPEIAIDWPDGGIPDLVKSDWMRLLQDLSEMDGKVLVHCMGGHGRTGTALAALLGLSKAVTKDPVKWLRKYYCEKVVETKAQFDYLKKLDIHSACEPKPLMIHNTTYQRNTSLLQEQYNLTKPDPTPKPYLDEPKPTLDPLYECILCRRKHTSAHFYQTFLDMTGFCWSCHQLTNKVNPDIQSA